MEVDSTKIPAELLHLLWYFQQVDQLMGLVEQDFLVNGVHNVVAVLPRDLCQTENGSRDQVLTATGQLK